MIHEADPDIMEECKWIKPSNPFGGARLVPRWDRLLTRRFDRSVDYARRDSNPRPTARTP
jgi:hypothetical protein